jgi:exosortase H (IPTLxxWG-CTERM-specific)
MAVLVSLFAAELWGPVQDAVVSPWTGVLATVSAGLLRIFDGSIQATGALVRSAATSKGVLIEAGCNGVEACLILVAGVVAYPASVRMRLVGIGLGFLAIQVMNLLRVISLFFLVGYSEAMFNFVHLYVWQVLIVLDVLVVWLLWVREVARRKARNHGKADQGLPAIA